MEHLLLAILALDQSYNQLKIFFPGTGEHQYDFVTANLLPIAYKL